MARYIYIVFLRMRLLNLGVSLPVDGSFATALV